MSTFLYKEERRLDYHISKHLTPKDTKLSTMCTVCLEEFPSFYSPPQHKKRNGTSTKVGTTWSEKLKGVLE